MRAAIYARYSSDEQTGGESIEYQLERCRAHIAEQGWSLKKENIFEDRARSGMTTYGRDEFNRMIGLAKQKDRSFDVVVAWSTSRFGRNQDEAIFNKISLSRQGVEVKFVSQPLPDGHIGKLIERIYEWKDEFDSIQIGEYAFQGQKQVTQKGFHGGGKAPYGYRLSKVEDPSGKTDKNGTIVQYGTFEIDADQAEVVRRIFALRAEGASYKKITHSLNDDAILSPGGGTWDISAVRSILFNESYLGRRVWNQTRRNKKARRGTKVRKPREDWVVVEDAHKPIITQEVWDVVEARRGRIQMEIKNGQGGHNTAQSPYMLTGLLKCQECGGNFVMSGRKRQGGKTGYYRCSFHARRGDNVCTNNRTVRQDVIEPAVLDLLSEKLLTRENLEDIYEEVQAQRAEDGSGCEVLLKDLAKRIRQVDSEIANLTAAIKAGGPIQELVNELKSCKERKGALEAEEAEIENQEPLELGEIDRDYVEEAVRNLKETLKNASRDEMKELLRQHIVEIRIPKGKKEKAQLEENPTGLLERCILLVTLIANWMNYALLGFLGPFTRRGEAAYQSSKLAD